MENLQSESAVGIRSALLKRIKGLQMAQRLGLFSPLQYWTLLVLQNRMEWICSLEFFSPAEENKRSAMALQFGLFSPLRFGPSSYSPMSRVKSLKSGSAERTKGLQTYGVALQFWTQGIEGPFGF